MSNKIHSKLIERVATGFKQVTGLTISGASSIITTDITTAFSTGALEGRSLPVINSTTELDHGLIVSGDYNKVPILLTATNTPLKTDNGEVVYARLTYAGSDYTITYYYLDLSNIETAYTIVVPTAVYVFLPYRGQFNHLSADESLFALVSRNFGTAGSGANKPELITEALTVGGLNVLSSLSQTPTVAGSVKLIFGGMVVSEQDTPTPFTVTGTLITWNPTNAGFDIDFTDNVIAEYLV